MSHNASMLYVSSSECRDEKRTESKDCYREQNLHKVAVSAAMKSGLKDPI